MNTIVLMGEAPDAAMRRILDELEANRKSRRTAWATLQRLRKFLEEHGTRIATPDERNFETEGEAIESGLRRTMQGRDMVMRSLIQAVYRFRDATLVEERRATLVVRCRICIESWRERKTLLALLKSSFCFASDFLQAMGNQID